jgi:hypothetical protein
MITKQFFRVDDDFFVYMLKEKDILKYYEDIVSKDVTIKYKNDVFVLYLDDTPEWESRSIDAIFENIVRFINNNVKRFTIKIGLEDVFNYICYYCEDKDMKLSSYEYLIECGIRENRKRRNL